MWEIVSYYDGHTRIKNVQLAESFEELCDIIEDAYLEIEQAVNIGGSISIYEAGMQWFSVWTFASREDGFEVCEIGDHDLADLIEAKFDWVCQAGEL